MTTQPFYNTGTAVLTNGSTAMVGTGTHWFGNIRAFDRVVGLDGKEAIVASVTDDTHIVLLRAWQGTTQATAAYEIWLSPDEIFLQTLARQIFETLAASALTGIGGLTPAANTLPYFDAGSAAALATLTAFARSILDDPDAATVLDTLGFSAFVKTIVDDADGPAVLTTLGFSTFIKTLIAAANAPALRALVTVEGPHNRLINGNGAINQRGATSKTDDAYAWDRHYVLTQTAAVGVSTLSNVQNGLPSMMRETQSQAVAQRMGIAQIIESKNCIGLRGKTVTLAGKLRNSLAAAVRYAILEWTGTADVPTSDVVNSWTNGTFTAGQFFNSTTLNVLAVGAVTPAAATVTDFNITATVGGSANNIIVMIWTETAQAQNSTLDVGWELLDYDATGKIYPTEFRSFSTELALCQRYYCKSFAQGVAPFDGQSSSWIASFAWSTIHLGTQTIGFPVTMAGIPTVSFFKPGQIAGTNGRWQWYDTVTAYQDSSTTTVSGIDDTKFSVDMTVSGATAKSGYIVQGQWTAEFEL